MFFVLLLLSTLDACRGLWRGRYVGNFSVFIISDWREGMGEGLMLAKTTVKNEVRKFFYDQISFWMGKHTTLSRYTDWKYITFARVKEYEMLTMLFALLLSFCMNVPHHWKKKDKMVVLFLASGCGFCLCFWVWRSRQIFRNHCNSINMCHSTCIIYSEIHDVQINTDLI